MDQSIPSSNYFFNRFLPVLNSFDRSSSISSYNPIKDVDSSIALLLLWFSIVLLICSVQHYSIALCSFRSPTAVFYFLCWDSIWDSALICYWDLLVFCYNDSWVADPILVYYGCDLLPQFSLAVIFSVCSWRLLHCCMICWMKESDTDVALDAWLSEH